MPVPVWLPLADSKKELGILPTDVGKSLPGRGRVVDGSRPFFGTFGLCAVYCGFSPAFGNSGFFVRYGKKRGLGRKLYQSKCAKRPFGCFIFPTADGNDGIASSPYLCGGRISLVQGRGDFFQRKLQEIFCRFRYDTGRDGDFMGSEPSCFFRKLATLRGIF